MFVLQIQKSSSSPSHSRGKQQVGDCSFTQLEEGEIDTERARQFAFCFKKVHRAETEKRNEKMRKDAQERRAILAEQRAKQQSTGSSTKIA